jgi:hypothetical protein
VITVVVAPQDQRQTPKAVEASRTIHCHQGKEEGGEKTRRRRRRRRRVITNVMSRPGPMMVKVKVGVARMPFPAVAERKGCLAP